MTLADVLDAVIEQPDEFLFDLYEHGRARGDTVLLWANGAPAVLRLVCDSPPLARRAVA
ncbi:MAG: hypothetical protein ACLPVY_00625 [Acidimicrobiia bacterium]